MKIEAASKTTVPILIVTFFAALSIASGSSKSTDASKGTASTTGGDPSKSAKLAGSCSRDDRFQCIEDYVGTTSVADSKSGCKQLGGQWHRGGCPRIKAITQCFQGGPEYLSGVYKYEGNTDKTDPSDCPHGFRDFRKSPDPHTPTVAPATCNALATAASCSQFSAVDADAEKSCLDDGATLKQPPEPCPTANGLVAYQLTWKTGAVETQNYYTTSYVDSDGATKTNKMEDALLLCVLAGSSCTRVPLGTANPGASAAPAASSAKAPSKAAPPAKKAPTKK